MKRRLTALSIACVLAGMGSIQAGLRPEPPAPSASAPQSITVPEGDGIPVLLDGLFAPGEWDDALRVPISERAELLFESTEGWLELVLPGSTAPGSRDRLSGRQAEDQEAEKAEIARVVSSVIGWAKDKDLGLFFGSIANDEDYISVTPGGRVIKRFEDVKQNVPFWMSPDFRYVRHELKDLEIKLARCGTVAWFYCVLDDINTYKGQPASWENARWTGVVEKRDGKWVVVSQHFSFASDK